MRHYAADVHTPRLGGYAPAPRAHPLIARIGRQRDLPRFYLQGTGQNAVR